MVLPRLMKCPPPVNEMSSSGPHKLVVGLEAVFGLDY
jgi:hypothetical protein